MLVTLDQNDAQNLSTLQIRFASTKQILIDSGYIFQAPNQMIPAVDPKQRMSEIYVKLAMTPAHDPKHPIFKRSELDSMRRHPGEEILDYLRIVYGVCMDYVWIMYVLVMDYVWNVWISWQAAASR